MQGRDTIGEDESGKDVEGSLLRRARERRQDYGAA
jgi:hypothetical protein